MLAAARCGRIAGAAAAAVGLAALPSPARGEAQPARILVVGSINVDLLQPVAGGNLPLSPDVSLDISSCVGQTLPAGSWVRQPQIAAQLPESVAPGDEEALMLALPGPFTQVTGGKGANTAAAAGLSCAGGRCVSEFIGNFGAASEAANQQLLSDFQRSPPAADLPSRVAGAVWSSDGGENSIVLVGGANQSWPQDLPSPLAAAVREAAVVMLQREVPDRVNLEVARAAHQAGVPVVMDVGGTDAPLDPKLMGYVSLIAPNESELSWISGVATTGPDGLDLALVRQAVTALREKFAAASPPNELVEVLVTLGSHGSIYFGRDGPETAMGVFRLQTADGKPADTTGAGDCFRGSFVAARYGLGLEIPQALRWAAAAGSLAVEVPGAMPSMPTRVQIEERCSSSECGYLMRQQLPWQLA